MCLYHNFFIHSYVNGHLGCFRVLAIANTGAMNNVIHVSLSVSVSSRYMSRSEIAGSYGAFGEGNGTPLQYSGLENSMDCVAHGVAKSQK